MRPLLAIAVLALAGCAAGGNAASDIADVATGETRPSLTVRVLGLRSDRGGVAFALYGSEETYDARTKPVRKAWLPVDGGNCAWEVRGLAPGEYAVLVYHDVNDNRELDRRKAFAIPKEPYGFSNDAAGRFGPPPFEEARFLLDGEPLAIEINLR